MEWRILIANGLILATVLVGLGIPLALWLRTWRARRQRQRRRRYGDDRPYFSNDAMRRPPAAQPPPAVTQSATPTEPAANKKPKRTRR